MENFYTYNLAFVLRKSKKDNEGKPPVYMRITINEQRAEVSIKRNIHTDNWENKACKAKGYKSEVKLRKELKCLSENDIKYRYIKMIGETNAEELSNLEDIFYDDKDKELIREIRKQVEKHEQENK